MSNVNKVTLRKVKDLLVVELPPALSAETKEEFNEKVQYALADTPAVLIIDFARVQSADADGIKSIHFAFLRCDEIDTPLILAGIPDAIRPGLVEAGYFKKAEEMATADEAVEKNL